MRSKQSTEFRAFFPPEADDLELDLIKEMLLFSADKRESAATFQLMFSEGWSRLIHLSSRALELFLRLLLSR